MASKLKLNSKRRLMDGEVLVLPRNNFCGQQQPQVLLEGAGVNLKNALCLPEFHHLSLSIGSGQDRPSGCPAAPREGQWAGLVTSLDPRPL